MGKGHHSEDSEDDDYDATERRRPARACDLCRRRKIRCENATATRPCDLCQRRGQQCTFDEDAPKRGSGASKAHVEALEARARELEAMLAGIAPQALAQAVPATAEDELVEQLESTQIHHHVFGSANIAAVLPILDSHHSRPLNSSTTIMEECMREHKSELSHALLGLNHADEFKVPADAEFVESLVKLYFDNVQPTMPLLHERSFRADLASGLATSSLPFRALVFSVLALGARFSDDARCLQSFGFLQAINQVEAPPPHARGFAFAYAARVLIPPDSMTAWSLYDLQRAALSVAWHRSTCSPMSVWSMLGFWCRQALDVGANRCRVGHWTASVKTDELRKRAFWQLAIFDRTISAVLGRSTIIQMDEIDVPQPLELTDDELDQFDAENLPYPRQSPRRSPDAPPTDLAAFNCLINLSGILAIALRTVYSMRKHTDDQQHRFVVNLDSLLSLFIDTLPVHLRWDSEQKDDRIFAQTCLVLSEYYGLQLAVHRIHPARKVVTAISLAIAVNAARSQAHVLDALRLRGLLRWASIDSAIRALEAAMILLITKDDSKLPDLTDSAVRDVQKCIAVIEASLDLFHDAQYIHKVLERFQSDVSTSPGLPIGQLPLATSELGASTWAGDPTFTTSPSAWFDNLPASALSPAHLTLAPSSIWPTSRLDTSNTNTPIFTPSFNPSSLSFDFSSSFS